MKRSLVNVGISERIQRILMLRFERIRILTTPFAGEERHDAEAMREYAVQQGFTKLIQGESKVIVDMIKSISWTQSETNTNRFYIAYCILAFVLRRDS